jgi:hypothetical protein
MAEELPNPSERPLKINRRILLSTAVGVTAGSIMPRAASSEVAILDKRRSLSTASEVLPPNVCTATARRLLEIERRNELRREAMLPPLKISTELRRMKQAEDQQQFSRFATRHSVADQLLKSRRQRRELEAELDGRIGVSERSLQNFAGLSASEPLKN